MKDGVKIFGLRSAKAYKMIPALLYYAAMAYFIGASIVGELLHYKFETIDYILMIEKYLFFAILFFSPLIFLSDFKYREKLPFFKKHTFGSSLSGMIIVWMFCYFMAQVCIMNMSNTWVQSRDVYTKQIQLEREENIKKNKAKESVTETVTVVETTISAQTRN